MLHYKAKWWQYFKAWWGISHFSDAGKLPLLFSTQHGCAFVLSEMREYDMRLWNPRPSHRHLLITSVHS